MEKIATFIARAPHLPIRIYLETGTFEDVRYETRERLVNRPTTFSPTRFAWRADGSFDGNTIGAGRTLG